MSVITEDKTAADAAVADRRRPGRAEQVNPALIPILRTGELPATLDEPDIFGEPDQIAGARGVLFGAAISAPLWVGIAYLGHWLLP